MRLTAIVALYGDSEKRMRAAERAMREWCRQSLPFDLVCVSIGALPIALPPATRHVPIRDDRPWHRRGIMQKEALQNLGAFSLREAESSDILVFLDGDIWSPDTEWFAKMAARFDECPGEDILVQGFRCWRDTEDRTPRDCSIGAAVASGVLDKSRIHPGFCWAMRRGTWSKMRGLNPWAITGSGDSLLVHELVPGLYETWVESESNWLGGLIRPNMPKVRLLHADADIVHENHGKLANRGYHSSWKAVEAVHTPIRDLVAMDRRGLIVWKDPRCALADGLSSRDARACAG